MPSKNENTAVYRDCFKVMEQALAVGGIRVEFPDRKRATVFRHRCYKGRSMLYRASAKTVPAGVLPFTQFDDILIRFESDVKPNGSDQVLVFQLRSKQELPAITDLEGNPLPEVAMPDFTSLKIEGIIIDD